MLKNKEVVLLAFASNDLKRSINRLSTQARESNFYSKIKIFNSNNLPKDLASKLDYLLSINKKRGYGYWIWKPYLIKKIFDEIQYGDVINYLDIGCHIVKENVLKFNEYLDFINTDDKWILPFQYHSNFNYQNKQISFPERLEKAYTKGDLLDYFGYYSNENIIKSPQYWAGCIFIKKTDKSINFINQWLEVFDKNFDLIDDSISKIKNYSDFVENRHDQSVYSLLCKRYKLKSFSAYECDWACLDNKRTWEHNKYSPILAKRDLKYNIFRRFLNRQKKTYGRLKKRLLEKIKNNEKKI